MSIIDFRCHSFYYAQVQGGCKCHFVTIRIPTLNVLFPDELIPFIADFYWQALQIESGKVVFGLTRYQSLSINLKWLLGTNSVWLMSLKFLIYNKLMHGSNEFLAMRKSLSSLFPDTDSLQENSELTESQIFEIGVNG